MNHTKYINHHSDPVLSNNCRDSAELAEFAAFWTKEVLLPEDTVAAAGFAYHIADIVLPELTRVVGESGNPPSNKVLAALFEPFYMAAAKTRDNVLVGKLQQGLFFAIIEELKRPQDADVLKKIDAESLAGRLFDLGKLIIIYSINACKEERENKERVLETTICT